MNAIYSCKHSLISHAESLPRLVLLIIGVALTVLGALEREDLLNLERVNGWVLLGPGLGFISILAIHSIATYIRTKQKEPESPDLEALLPQLEEAVWGNSTESQLEVLWEKNKASHIPIAEFRELVTFLQTHSPKMRTAIEEGSLFEQTVLNLSFKELTELPNSLAYLINLTELDVSNNQLATLPDAIGRLTSLTELDVTDNQLATLPDAIGRLTSLTELNVVDNQLATLPNAIGRLTSLTELNVAGNQLTTLPNAIGRLTSLTELNVAGNQLVTLPNAIGRLTSLTELDVSYNPCIVFSDVIGKLTNLTKLDVSNSQLTVLPDAIAQLTNLTLLNVSHNQLTALPDTIGQLTKLTLLNVDCNQLAALPDTIGQLTKLTHLYAYYNQLTTLPDTIGRLTSLTLFNVDRNQLAALPDTIGRLTSLTKLSVDNNKLTTLPDTIGQLINLDELHVNSNQLTALPNTVGDLSVLRILQIDRNSNLSALPLSLGNCSQLTHLSIAGTYIPQSNCNEILAACRNMRNLEAFEKLPYKIKLWRKFADIAEEWVGPEFTKEQKGNLYEWLLRLEKANDFKKNQKELTKTTCAILKTVHTDAKFREIFFNLIAADLTACGDRAAMSLNLVYTDWKLYTLPAEASLSEKVQLLVGCGRALKLRNLVLQNPGYEIVEKVLYVEVKLRERLGLVTAITSMLYEAIGHVQDSIIEEIAKEIEAISDAELVVEFGYWENYLKEYHASEFSAIKGRIQAARDTLLTSLESDEIKEGEYNNRDQDLQDQEQKAILKLTQKIIDRIKT